MLRGKLAQSSLDEPVRQKNSKHSCGGFCHIGLDRIGTKAEHTGCGLNLLQCPSHHSLPDSHESSCLSCLGQETRHGGGLPPHSNKRARGSAFFGSPWRTST
jgi:hypothetical protein